MKECLLSFILLMGLYCSPSAVAESQSASSEKTVIKLDHGTNDLHSVFMGVKIAKALLEKNQDVTIFVNLEAVRLVDKTQPLDLKWGMSKTNMRSLYHQFVKAGGKILVCPHCAKAAGVKDLREGATIATESQVAELFSNASRVIDY